MRHIIDVREPDEHADSAVAGAVNIPLTSLARIRTSHPDIAPDDEIVVYCRTGRRAETASNILTQLGFHHVVNGLHKEHVEKHHL